MPDIIKKVFADHPVADFKFELTGTYRKWTYCVQYRETDFNFVSRLMEQEGIYYYFRHTDGHNTLVLTDSCSKHAPCPGYEELSVHPARAARAAGARAHQQLGVLARGAAGRLRARRLRPRAAERRPEDAEGPVPQVLAEQLRGLRLSRRLPAEGRRRTVRLRPHRRARDAVRDHQRRDQRPRHGRRGAVHARRLSARRPEPRAPRRRGELRPRVQRLRGAARRAADRAISAASRRCRRSSSSGRSAPRRSRSSRGRRRRWSSARPATRSTPTSSGA